MTITTIFLTLVGIYAIVTIYKTGIKKHWFALTVIGIIAFVFSINRLETRNQRLVNQEFKSLFVNSDFAIGQVEYYTNNGGTKPSYRTTIKYSFRTKDSVLVKETAGTLLPDSFDKKTKQKWNSNFNNAEKGDQFLVLYSGTDSVKSIMHFGTQIKKNQDYEKIKNEINKSRIASD